ncbi:biotin--[acetyl-CoA-carboxylase] ligase [Oleispirillum naphthae]|uniref:biotin--[acetyl-CoA-carboxylase] ligase n=1 Tax=Oleispirillum naphthae TaxID=2838853 RepID=UPI00308259ED
MENSHTVALPAGWRLFRRGTVGSTNREARLLADAGEPEGAVVWADAQTEGRGRQDRVWESGGGNLLFSLIVRPECGLAEAGQLSFLTAVALAEAVAEVAPAVPVTCKWPNDLLGAHGKISGILLEGCLPKGALPPAVVVGVGVNIAWQPGEGTLYPASSLAREGAEVSREAVLAAFLARFSAWLAHWRAEGFAPLRAAWLARARGVGQAITVRLPGETVKGVFENLDGDGGLVLSGLPEGERVIHAGDVFFG